MKAIFASLMLGLFGIITLSGPASAQEWWEKAIADSKRASGETSSRSNRTARAERPTRTVRAVTSDDDSAETPRRAARARAAAQSEDDGSRPQRRQAATQRAPRSIASDGETGVASYYWQPQRVASGGWFNPDAMTAAHKTLPFGTRVRVTRLDNGNSVTVTINDRGPYVGGRIIDLSRAAAQSIGMTGQGLARVSVSTL